MGPLLLTIGLIASVTTAEARAEDKIYKFKDEVPAHYNSRLSNGLEQFDRVKVDKFGNIYILYSDLPDGIFYVMKFDGKGAFDSSFRNQGIWKVANANSFVPDMDIEGERIGVSWSGGLEVVNLDGQTLAQIPWPGSYMSTVEFLSDGKIFGQMKQNHIYKIMPDYSYDLTFANQGILSTPQELQVLHATELPSGSLFIDAIIWNGTMGKYGFGCIASNGSICAGHSVYASEGTFDTPDMRVLQSVAIPGSVKVVGREKMTPENYIFKELDEDFNHVVEYPARIRSGERFLHLVSDQDDGSIYIATMKNADNTIYIYKFSAEGTLDPAWGQAGIASIVPNRSSKVTMILLGSVDRHMAITPDKSVVVAGICREGSPVISDVCVAKLTPNGELDVNFDGDGFLYMEDQVIRP